MQLDTRNEHTFARYDTATYKAVPKDAIVLDLGRTHGTNALIRVLRSAAYYDIAAQIEAQTKPPRIPEPGLWAVVQDSDGNYYVRDGIAGNSLWVIVFGEAVGTRWSWDDLLGPVLVRPGIEDGAS